MALTTDELTQIKIALGYGGMAASARPYFDVALVFADVVKNGVESWAEGYIRSTLLVNILAMDTKIQAASSVAGIKELVGDVVFDTGSQGSQLAQLARQRDYWCDRLAEILRVPRADKPACDARGARMEVG